MALPILVSQFDWGTAGQSISQSQSVYRALSYIPISFGSFFHPVIIQVSADIAAFPHSLCQWYRSSGHPLSSAVSAEESLHFPICHSRTKRRLVFVERFFKFRDSSKFYDPYVTSFIIL